MKTELLTLSLLAGCLAVEHGSESTIEAPRIIALLADPPESAAGAEVRLRAVIAAPLETTAALAWSFCATPREATDNTSASAACAATQERPLIDQEASITTRLPADACSVFGSETAAGTAPVRADLSGGYYQPVRVALADDVMVARLRVRCALPNAPIATVRSFDEQYRANVAPGIDGLDAPVLGDELALRLRPAADARETYLVYDPATAELRQEREQLTVSWFVTAGEIEPPRADVERVVRWRAPAGVPEARVWAVLRDDRGGVAVHEALLHTAP